MSEDGVIKGPAPVYLGLDYLQHSEEYGSIDPVHQLRSRGAVERIGL